MPRTAERSVSRPNFLADPASAVRSGGGKQINWSGVSASFVNAATGKKELPAGLRVKLTAGGQLVDNAGTGTLYGLLETNAVEGHSAHALTGYGVLRGGNVYLQLLPEVLDGAAQTALAAVGTGFSFETYNDNRAS